MLSSFLPYPFHVLQGISTQMPYFKEIIFFLPLAIFFAFHLLTVIVTFALFIALWQWHQCFTLLLRSFSKHMRKKGKKTLDNSHSTWCNEFFHPSQLKWWKNCCRRQNNFCMIQIICMSVLHRSIKDRIREQKVTQAGFSNKQYVTSLTIMDLK